VYSGALQGRLLAAYNNYVQGGVSIDVFGEPKGQDGRGVVGFAIAPSEEHLRRDRAELLPGRQERLRPPTARSATRLACSGLARRKGVRSQRYHRRQLRRGQAHALVAQPIYMPG